MIDTQGNLLVVNYPAPQGKRCPPRVNYYIDSMVIYPAKITVIFAPITQWQSSSLLRKKLQVRVLLGALKTRRLSRAFLFSVVSRVARTYFPRKLMRAPQPFAYVIDKLPTSKPIFDFIQQHGPVDDREAYGNLNMSADFALYVAEADVQKTLDTLAFNRFTALRAGYIEKSEEKKVVIRPKGLEYSGATLGVR